jgi:hypothetical protein
MHMNETPPPLTRLDPRARGPMEALVRAAMAKSPAQRPTAEGLAKELARVVDVLGDAATLSAVAGRGA